jgi:hypothetical protein
MTQQLSVREIEKRAGYMVMWVSRKTKQRFYSATALRQILRLAFDETIRELLDTGHIVPVGQGFYLTDAGVRAWAVMATECATINNFDPELKVWANWIMEVRELLECLTPGEWVHPARHVDANAHTKAARKGWVKFKSDSPRTREYLITESGIEHLASIQEKGLANEPAPTAG